MSDLIKAAFTALGTGPSHREVQLVAEAIRESGDAEALRVFEDAAVGMGGEGFAALATLAEECGSSPYVALDLLPQVFVPGWSPFPAGNPRARELDQIIERLRAAGAGDKPRPA